MAAEAETQVVPRATYNFRIKVNGLLAAYCSAVQKPKIEKAEIRHASGGARYDIKRPGKINVEDLVLEKAKPANEGDRWAWDWMMSTSDFDGNGDILGTMEIITIEELAEDNDTAIDTFEYEQCWIKSIEESKNDAMQEGERMMETITISVGKPTRK